MDTIYQKISWVLPKRLIYFCFIRFWANATTKDEGCKITPDKMNWTKAIELWERI